MLQIVTITAKENILPLSPPDFDNILNRIY